MSEPIEIKKIKVNALIKLFKELGYQTSNKIGQNEIQLFLNKQSKTGRFDPILTGKLFEVLSLDQISSTMTIEEFIKEFLEFEDDIQKNAELFRIKLIQEKEIYEKILDQCRLYQYEKLNAEGFCESAKIYGEITDVNIKEKLDGINEIIILIIYNDKKEELRFRLGDKNSKEMLKKSFSFRPTSRKDNFEFIMRGVNEQNQIFDIGSKVFPLNDIISQEEYLVQIVIPEIDNPNKIVAYINAKIVLYMSDFKHYESLRRKQEKRLKKFMVAANKASEYLKCVREIYGDLSVMNSEITVNYNNEKLMQRKGAKLNINFNNVMEQEAPRSNYFVEYNNQREVQKKDIPLKIEINNTKEIINPVTETRNYEYKYNYTSNINQNVINDIEKKIEILNNDKQNIMNNIQNIPKPNIQIIPMPNMQNIPKPNIQTIPIPNIQKPNIDQVNIKRTTENIIIKNQEQPKIIENKEIQRYIIPNQVFTNEQVINKNQEQTNIVENKEIQRYIIPNQVFTNEQVIKEQINSQQIIPSILTQPMSESIELNSNDNSKIFQKIQTTTETETKNQNISNPQYMLVNPKINETKFDIDSFLKQTTTRTETQEQTHKITNPIQAQTQSLTQMQNQMNQMYTQQLNQNQTQIQTQTQPQKQIQYQKQENIQKQIQIQNQKQSQKQIQYQKQEHTQKEIQTQNLPQTQIQTKVQTQTEQIQNKNIYPTQISYIKTSQNNNTGASQQIKKTTETTETVKTTPAYFQNKYQAKKININANQYKTQTQNQNQNILIKSAEAKEKGEAFLKSFLSGENVDQYINTSNKKTTTTKTTTTEQQTNQYKSSNIKVSSNKTDINNRNIVVSTQYQKGQKIEYIRPSVHEIIAEILKKKTIMKEPETLEPIINKVKVSSSCNNALLNEFNGKTVVSEKTLPVSYLPEKVNKIIYEEKITTLPIIRANSPPTYKVLKTIVHEPKIIYKGEINIENNANITDNNYADNNNRINIHKSHNNLINNISVIRNNRIQYNNNYVEKNDGNNYNFNMSGNFNYLNNIPSAHKRENSSIIMGNPNYNIVSNGNDYFTTQNTEKKAIYSSQINPNFNMNNEEQNYQGK
jgi:hypothetical protein